MAIKMTVFNPKGGVGKTTSAKSIAGELSKRGYKVLLVDCDSSADTTRGISQSEKPEYELAKLVVEYCDVGYVYDEEAVRDCICHSDFPNLDIIPATTDAMQEAENIMQSADKMLEPDKAFSMFFKDVEKDYDYIIYDTKEGEGQWHRNVLNHVDYLLCPSVAESDSISGYLRIMQKLNLYKRFNPKLKFLGMFISCYYNDSKGEGLLEVARSSQPEFFIPVVIRYSKILGSARLDKAPVCYYKDDSNPAIDYKSLTDYILDKTGSKLYINPEEIDSFDAEKLMIYTMMVYPDEIMNEYKTGKRMYNKVLTEYKQVAADYKWATGEKVTFQDKYVQDDIWLCEHDVEYKQIFEDIKDNGIIDPVIVTPLNIDGHYMIIDGAKRRDAAIELGQKVPIRVIWEMDKEDDFASLLVKLAKEQITRKVEYANSATRKLKEELTKINKKKRGVNNG